MMASVRLPLNTLVPDPLLNWEEDSGSAGGNQGRKEEVVGEEEEVTARSARQATNLSRATRDHADEHG
jgi:hypothetical protein